jgi:hypothetical protein
MFLGVSNIKKESTIFLVCFPIFFKIRKSNKILGIFLIYKDPIYDKNNNMVFKKSHLG